MAAEREVNNGKGKKEQQAREEIMGMVARYYHAYKEETQTGNREFIPGDRIPYSGRVYDEAEMCALADAALDFWLTAGKYAEQFEKDFAAWLGVKYACMVSSGSSANLLAFMALTAPELGERAIRRGDEVITTACGFPTTVSPILQYGAVPVFVDVAIPQYNIDITKLEEALSPRTKAVIIAHTLGNPFNIAAVRAFCRAHNLWLVEDNCDALGSLYTGPVYGNDAAGTASADTHSADAHSAGKNADTHSADAGMEHIPSCLADFACPGNADTADAHSAGTETACRYKDIAPFQNGAECAVAAENAFAWKSREDAKISAGSALEGAEGKKSADVYEGSALAAARGEACGTQSGTPGSYGTDSMGCTSGTDGACTFQTKYTGTWGDIGTSSFYPPHHITTGEGGCVYTDNPLLHKIILSYRDWGRDCVCPSGKDNCCGQRFSGRHGLLPQGYDHKYTYSHLGYNLKITDLQAAIGCAQLKKLPDFISRRRHNWQHLDTALRERLQEKHLEDAVILPEPEEHSVPSWFGYIISVRPESGAKRDAVTRYLEEHNIQTRLLFAGNLLKQPCMDAYRDTGACRVAGTLENTDYVMCNSFWVGVYPGITDAMTDYMADIILQALECAGACIGGRKAADTDADVAETETDTNAETGTVAGTETGTETGTVAGTETGTKADTGTSPVDTNAGAYAQSTAEYAGEPDARDTAETYAIDGPGIIIAGTEYIQLEMDFSSGVQMHMNLNGTGTDTDVHTDTSAGADMNTAAGADMDAGTDTGTDTYTDTLPVEETADSKGGKGGK